LCPFISQSVFKDKLRSQGIAIGHPGDAAELAQDLREREQSSTRKRMAEIAFEVFYRR
jgi:hypothetical protein